MLHLSPPAEERGFHGILRPFPIEAHLAVPFATTTGSAVALCLVSCHRSILRIIEREEPVCQWNMHTEDVEAARSVSLESPGSDYPAAMVSLPQPARSSIQRANVDMPDLLFFLKRPKEEQAVQAWLGERSILSI